jgi:hypothetical protein
MKNQAYIEIIKSHINVLNSEIESNQEKIKELQKSVESKHEELLHELFIANGFNLCNHAELAWGIKPIYRLTVADTITHEFDFSLYTYSVYELDDNMNYKNSIESSSFKIDEVSSMLENLPKFQKMHINYTGIFRQNIGNFEFVCLADLVNSIEILDIY